MREGFMKVMKARSVSNWLVLSTVLLLGMAAFVQDRVAHCYDDVLAAMSSTFSDEVMFYSHEHGRMVFREND